MDQSSLKNSDVLILTGLTQMPTANPDGMLGEFCSNLGRFKYTENPKSLLDYFRIKNIFMLERHESMCK